ncbi:MAG: SDR family oxidoreductase [Gammaproteobacteria bacterium]|nr:SDR family oxidoreductase [Gammaproteobacteria bacterium]
MGNSRNPDRLALVTGGSSGIGAHLVRAFARAGHAVAFNFVGAGAAADALVAELCAGGARVLAVPGDAGSVPEVEAFHAQAAAWYGGVPDVLVNNAGIQTWASLLELEEERWDAVLRTNLKGCFLNTQQAARRMVAAGKGGAIVNIGSGCNKLAFPKLVDYTASKGGIEQFTKAAALDLGPHGIRVNCVAPGAIATERTLREADNYAATWSALTPLRRIGTPEDVAAVVLFLASPAAAFVTGQTIGVDGGLFTQAVWPHPSG